MGSDHLDTRIVARWDGHPAERQRSVGSTGNRDLAKLAGRLDEPVAALAYSGEELRKIKSMHHLEI